MKKMQKTMDTYLINQRKSGTKYINKLYWLHLQ